MTLQEVFPQVVIVSPPRDYRPRVDAVFVHDPVPPVGPLGGLMAAIRHAGGRPTFVLACDLPFVSAELLRYLIRRSRVGAVSTERESDFVVSIPSMAGRPQPLCGLYGSRCLTTIETALGSGEFGVQDLLTRVATDFVQIDPGLPFVHEDLFLNINTPRDLRRAERRLAGSVESTR